MRALALGALLWTAACSGTAATTAAVEVRAEALDGQECAVCGMTVRDQPSPRGQVQHRDGTHLHFCSIGDLRAHLEVRNAHGPVVGTWVEALPASYDPAVHDTAILPTIAATDASYVVGFERPRVMGRPTLAYADRADAESSAARIGGRVVTWADLTSTPSHQVP